MAAEERVEIELEDAALPYEGEPILSWAFDEYERHERGTIWFILAILAGIGLLIYALFTQNFLFAVIVVMFGVLIGLTTIREPRKLVFVVTDLGVSVGERFFPYNEFRNFWIVYDPPQVKNVYMQFKTIPRQSLIVPIDDHDPNQIRETLLNYLEEERGREEEPFLDFLARFLKL